jgi:hypothetical protein
MIAIRILALLGWTIVRMVILPLAALHYVNGVVIIEVGMGLWKPLWTAEMMHRVKVLFTVRRF